jgi:hypothetical protein
MMADKMAKRGEHDGNGATSYQYLQREHEGTLSPFLVSSLPTGGSIAATAC